LRALARLALLLGAAAIGILLLRAAPREVTLVYGLPDPASVTSLEVEIRRGGDSVRRAEFRFARGAPPQVRHEVRLPEGEYEVTLRLSTAAGAARAVTRPVTVAEGGPIVLPLGEPPH
jgi:hypothetical protein